MIPLGNRTGIYYVDFFFYQVRKLRISCRKSIKFCTITFHFNVLKLYDKLNMNWNELIFFNQMIKLL